MLRTRAPAGLIAALLVLGLPSSAGAARAPAADRISLYFGVERPEAAARAAFMAVQQPGSPSYRRFLTPGQAARRYGASARTGRRLRRVARRLGFVARLDESRVFARLTGRVGRFEQVFDVRFLKQFDNDVFANTWYLPGRRTLRVPRPLRPLVREVVPIYARSTRRGRATQAGPAPGNAGTWTDGCDAARATGAYSFAQVRTAYGLDALGSGAGASVAYMNVGEGIPAADVAFAASCFGLPALRPRTLLTDGQRRPFGRGSPEPQEDLALIRGMAPGLSSVTLSQVWLTTGLWFLGPAQLLAAPSLPDTFSISYGLCERDVRGRRAGAPLRSNAALLDSLVVRLGLAGVGTFASAGDFGSTCNGEPFAGVAWPASSPYVTAVGGTRLELDAANARVDEVVWNDLAWLTTDNGGGAGGGGFSAVSSRPPYQRGLALPGGRRAVPDTSAHASMLPGWPVSIGGNWLEDAGTSASSPLVASAFAVISSGERAAGRPPLGPVNGLLYSLGSAPSGPIFDVVTGANGYDSKVPAQQAGPGYDLASGLGVGRFDRIAAALPAPAP